MDRSDFEGISAVIKELFGKSEDAFVNPPFYCDYGKHIEVGKNFFANYNCTLLDVAKIKLVITVKWRQMWRFTRQVILYIQ